MYNTKYLHDYIIDMLLFYIGMNKYERSNTKEQILILGQ